jgi:hypothetical protein
MALRIEKNVEQLFYRGDFQKILELTIDRPDGTCRPGEAPYLVGALSYLGRIDEAEIFFSRFQKKMSREGETLARLFLGTALCRHSHYDKAQTHFIANLICARRHRSPRIQVAAYQGVAFYRYFCGRYAVALKAGTKAFQAAVEGDYLYGKFLTADLMGHALVQTGHISAGLQRLRESIRYSKAIGDGETNHAVRISLAVYQAAFGISPTSDIETLQKLERKLSPQDNYSQASLLLEIGRQLSLRGRHRASQQALNDACRLIYSSSNRRQGVVLNLRYAQNQFLIGEYHQALSLIRSTTRELDPRVDKALQLQIYGMELKLKRVLGLSGPEDPLEARVRRLVSYTGMGIGRRILNRERGGSTVLRALGEDPLGDLLDVSQSETSGDLGDILRSGYLSLLYQRLPITPGESSLYFDLEPDSVLIVDRGDLEFVSRGFSHVLKGIARALEGGECPKEKLIEQVWGYRYDRLRHDSLIYQAISRLRQLLGERGRWVEATERGYRLNSQVRVRFYRRADAERSPAQPSVEAMPGEDELLATLNHRQLQILRRFRNHEFFDVQTCKSLFKVSQITATRDLSGLHKLRLVTRVGKGRATRYYSTGG